MWMLMRKIEKRFPYIHVELSIAPITQEDSFSIGIHSTHFTSSLPVLHLTPRTSSAIGSEDPEVPKLIHRQLDKRHDYTFQIQVT